MPERKCVLCARPAALPAAINSRASESTHTSWSSTTSCVHSSACQAAGCQGHAAAVGTVPLHARSMRTACPQRPEDGGACITAVLIGATAKHAAPALTAVHALSAVARALRMGAATRVIGARRRGARPMPSRLTYLIRSSRFLATNHTPQVFSVRTCMVLDAGVGR